MFLLEICDFDCGEHGHCQSQLCVCDEGWHGEKCGVKKCDPRCSAHGMCSNGTCLCTNGWNGKHCTLEGCPGNCHGHGSGCEIELEQECDDKRDNDNGEHSIWLIKTTAF